METTMITREKRRIALVLALALAALAAPARAAEIDFEDVGVNLPIDGEFYYDGADGAGGFVSQGASFSNAFTDYGGGCCWEGWAYSQTSDTTTPGFGNQYSAFPGGGADASATYGVGYPTGSGLGGVATITFASERMLDGGYFTNTTYAALSMLNGDAFAKQFGGASGDDPDWLLLTVTGYDAAGAPSGSVEVYLADYRFADNALDYVLDEWLWVDLADLGSVESLDFVLSGSDVGAFGLNTPAYFALDGLHTVPEPGSTGLLAVGLAGLAASGRHASRRPRGRTERLARRPQ
jgi:hypothetical protein